MTTSELSPNDLPLSAEFQAQLQMNVADFVMFCCEDDEDDAEEFIEEVKAAGKEKGVDICGYMYNDPCFYSGRELKSVEAVTSVAVQVWFYVTEQLAEDTYMQMYKDEQLMRALLDSNRNAIVPIWIKNKTEYDEIPYGLAAFVGLNRTNKNVMRTIVRMFDSPKHKILKQQLIEKQDRKKKQWAEETKIRAEKRKREEEKHEKLLKNVGKLSPGTGYKFKLSRVHGRTDIEKKLDEIMVYLKQLPQFSDERESEMPDYLHNSLDSLRSSNSSMYAPCSKTYNITINQPRTVTIGSAAAANPTNITINEGNNRSRSTPAGPIHTQSSECRGNSPVRSSTNSDSDCSFEKMDLREEDIAM